MAQLQMFVVNIRFGIGLLFSFLLTVAVVIGVWTGVKVLIFHVRQKRADDEERRRKFQPDGRPWPPAAPGICGECNRVLNKVYHLPDGRRLCPECYQVAADT